MSEREFWLAVRRALLMICAAIEKRYLQPRKSSSALSNQATADGCEGNENVVE